MVFSAMRIDQKYFNLFVGVVAVFAVMAIIFFNLRYAANQRSGFVENIGDGVELYNTWLVNVAGTDSVRASDFADKYVVIDFWATWSTPAVESHQELWDIIGTRSGEVVVLAATIKDGSEQALDYARQNAYNFIYLNGTDVFQKLLVPGVPSQVVYKPSGELLYVRIGYTRASDYNALRETLGQF